MQIPAIEQFRENVSHEYGHVWSADPEGADFTLMLPDGERVWEDGGWESRPHGPSYQLALAVLPQVHSLKEQAVAFLAGIVKLDELELEGEPYVNAVHCHAPLQRVIVELGWSKEAYVAFSVTFRWSLHPQMPHHVSPYRMAFWNA